MTRDMDLVRSILLTIEKSDKFSFSEQEGTELHKGFGDEYTAQQIRYHLVLLEEAGLIKYQKTGRRYQVSVNEWDEEEALSRLTWEGHEFIEAARDQNRWNQAKETISEKGGSLTLDVLKGVLTQLARQAVGL